MKTSRATIFGSVLIFGLAFISCKKEGCTDPVAVNYESSANHDNGTCSYDPSSGGAGGSGGSGGGTTNTITSNITSATTLSGIVSVCGDINIESAVTIQPGTVLNMCPGSSLVITSTGSLSSQGTAASPVIIQGETNSPAFWDGIRFTSNNPTNQLLHTLISDAGGYWLFEEAALYVNDQAQLAMSNSTVANCSSDGLFTNEASILNNFSNNTFSNNGSFGINITANQIGSLDVSSNYNNGNVQPFVNVRASTVNQTVTWQDINSLYLFNGITNITSAVTIEAGANFVFEANSGITVETNGSLTAIGTTTSTIGFAGRFNSAGYWNSVRFESNNPNNRLNHVVFMDGGSYWVDSHSSLVVSNGARLEIDNTSISNSNSWGMLIGTSTVVVTNGATVTDAPGVLTNNTMTGNGSGPDANCAGGGCTVLFQ